MDSRYFSNKIVTLSYNRSRSKAQFSIIYIENITIENSDVITDEGKAKTFSPFRLALTGRWKNWTPESREKDLEKEGEQGSVARALFNAIKSRLYTRNYAATTRHPQWQRQRRRASRCSLLCSVAYNPQCYIAVMTARL